MAHGKIWSDEENDLIVADYFSMLNLELSHQTFVKSDHNSALRQLFESSGYHRSHKAVELKHQNISAVLLPMGLPYIQGYRPADNFQKRLKIAVERWLDAHPGDFVRPASLEKSHNLAEDAPEWKGPPPKVFPKVVADVPQSRKPIARKVDYAAKDAANRELGRAGELFVLEHERAVLRQAGRGDLADKVRWVAKEDGDGLGYDIASFTTDGTPRLIEVKTTEGGKTTPFHISRNELEVAKRHPENWCLVRLWNFGPQPRSFELQYPLAKSVHLTPESFVASFGSPTAKS